MKKLILNAFASATLALFAIQPAHAILNIEITQASDNPIPIAIAPFGPIGAQGDVADIIRADLVHSGKFSTIDPDNMRQRPNSPQGLDYEYWRALDMAYLTVGNARSAGNGYGVNFSLVNLYAGQPNTGRVNGGELIKTTATNPILLSEELNGRAAQFRALAHHISDLIYEKLLGQKGVFSTRIAYVSVQRFGKQAQYVLEVADADGFNPKPLVTSTEPLMSPSWSPDGRQLAYVSFENHRAGIYIIDVATGVHRKISSYPGINGAPAWSPDGRQLAVVLSKEKLPKVYILDVASGQARAVTAGSGIDTEPNWSPDGRSLVFTSDRSGSGKPQIYRKNLATGAVDRITFDGDYNARATFTPDGKRIVMVHRDSGAFHIATQELATGKITLLSRSMLDDSPSVAPNGNMVIYATREGGRGVLAEVSIDGRVQARLPAGSGDVQDPAWSPFSS